MQSSERFKRSAFTLIELLVVVAIIALLIAILLPSLARAREQTKQAKCLANVSQWGKAVMLYVAENRDGLPGDSHPAIFRWQGIDVLTNNEIKNFTVANAQKEQTRYLSYRLRRQFNDSDGSKKSVTDEIATCPTLLSVNPDSNWIQHAKARNRAAFPTHYVLNNWGPDNADDPDGGGAVFNPRTTDPPFYFGYSSPGDSDLAKEAKFPPQQHSKVRKPSDEWMIADAWYRAAGGFVLSSYYQQEGPYQSIWSGNAMPNFAPHFAKRSSYSIFPDDASRIEDDSVVRTGKLDGRTVTVFFDGHGEGVASQVCKLGAAEGDAFELLYGFRGTVNLADPKVSGEIPYWQ